MMVHFDCAECTRVNSIRKCELQQMISNQSPRLRFEVMSMGARYRRIFKEIIVDEHPINRHLLCKICNKAINRGINSVTALRQHWRRHVLKGETPNCDDSYRHWWNAELDMPHGTRQQDMNNFVVPIKVPYSTAYILRGHRPVKVYMQFDNDAELREMEEKKTMKAKKAKLGQPEQENLDDTQPLPPDYDWPGPDCFLSRYEVNFPLVIADSSSTSTSC